jgi:HAD superfamily hydrolase (TIGR01549 family)
LATGKELLKDYDLFIFDWDGTLCEMQVVLRANEWFKRRIHTWNRESKIKEVELNRKQLKRAVEIDETKNEILVSVFEALTLFYKPRLHRNTIELLKLLKKRGKKIAILSNGNSSRLTKELEKTGLSWVFDVVMSAKDSGVMKPDPRGIKIIGSKLKVNTSRILYFGDMIDDVLTADLAKVDSCALANGFDSHTKLKSVHPTYLFKSVEELYNQIR